MAANYAKQLENYFQNVSQEELDKAFEALKAWNDVGPKAEDYLKLLEEIHGKQERE